MISASRPGLREGSHLDVALKFRDCKAKRKKKARSLKLHLIDNLKFSCFHWHMITRVNFQESLMLRAAGMCQKWSVHQGRNRRGCWEPWLISAPGSSPHPLGADLMRRQLKHHNLLCESEMVVFGGNIIKMMRSAWTRVLMVWWFLGVVYRFSRLHF